MKQRITSLDIQVLTKEVQSSIVGYRLQNIYNLLGNDRIFSLKFSKPDSKKSLIIDYGYKFYLTQYDRPTEPQPSNFVTKLRKHIKSKRLTNFKQIDKDRIVVLEFSNGRFYLVLEFFSAGNLILLDQELTILALSRVVNDNRVKEKYSAFDPSTLFADSIKYYNDDDENDENGAITEVKPEETASKTCVKKVYTSDNIEKWLESAIFVDKKNNKKVLSILKILFLNCSYLSNELIQKELILAGINPSESSLSLKEDKELQDSVIQCLNNCESRLDEIFENSTGYLLLKKNPLYNPEKEKNELANIQNALIKEEELTTEYKYENFSPFEPVLIKDKDDYKILKIKGYNNALDKFFSDVEILKNKLRLQHSQAVLDTKLNAVKNENIAKISKLEALETTNYQKGELIILHSALVDQCISIVTEKLNSGMSWDNINTVLKKEQEDLSKRGITEGNVLNTIVLPLDLKVNKMTVQLPEPAEDEDEEEVYEKGYDTEISQEIQQPNSSAEENDIIDDESDNDSLADLSDLDLSDEDEDEPIQKQKNGKTNKSKNKGYSAPTEVPEKPKKFVKIVVELGMSAHANSKTYFSLKKTATIKKMKTEQTASMALKNSTKKINATLKKQIEQSNKDLVIKKQRHKYWFEKFHWFLSSEGYVVIAAKDTLQLEMIYYKYFNSKYDYYVHSDMESALHVFVKNNFKDREIPPSTLNQAAMFSLSSSKAWNNKLISAAWYSEGSKVSKKDRTGTLLPDGMLEVEEKKFLPPMPLNMGVGFIWCLKQDEIDDKTIDDSLEYVDELTDVKDVQVERMNKLNESIKQIESNKDEVSSKSLDEIEEKEVDKEEVVAEKSSKESTKEKEFKKEKPPQSKSSSRSKKAKQKKLNQYIDQDEEDREMRLQALGVLKQQQQAKKDKQQEEENAKQEAKNRSGNEKFESIRQKRNYSEQFMDILSDGDSNNQYEKINFKRDISKELCVAATNDKELESLDDLIPTFAPWLSLQKYKYKVKVQPGNGKAGKSMNEITHYFMNRKVHGKNNDNIDFEVDFETEHAIINSLKAVDLLPDFTVKGIRVVLPAGSGKNNNGGGNGKGGKSSKKKK